MWKNRLEIKWFLSNKVTIKTKCSHSENKSKSVSKSHSPSPTEAKRLFYKSVSFFFLFCIEGYH